MHVHVRFAEVLKPGVEWTGLVHMVLVSGSHLFNKKKEQDDAPAKAAKSHKSSFKSDKSSFKK
jgi:hypothetical protein